MGKRLKCIDDRWCEGFPDPDFTKGKFYDVIDEHVLYMGAEESYSVMGDNGVEVVRPKYIFCALDKIARWEYRCGKCGLTLKKHTGSVRVIRCKRCAGQMVLKTVGKPILTA